VIKPPLPLRGISHGGEKNPDIYLICIKKWNFFPPWGELKGGIGYKRKIIVLTALPDNSLYLSKYLRV
jgi:hypothetical protein